MSSQITREIEKICIPSITDSSISKEKKIRESIPLENSVSIENYRNNELRKQYETALDFWISSETEKTYIDTKLMVKRKLLSLFDKKSRKLKLYKIGLCSIPPLFGLTCLRHIQIFGTNITHVDFKVFENLKDLQTLNLNFNHIARVIDVDLSYSLNLKKLCLEHNAIREIRNLNLSHCPQFKKLNLNYNPIESIKDLNLSHCEKIQNFMLCYFPLQILDNVNLSNCPNLRKIRLEYLKLQRIGNFDFTNSTSIEIINLYNDCLETFPTWDLSRLINLSIIDLDRNKLSDLGANLLSILPRLIRLELTSNHFLELNSEVLNLITPQLRIDLSDNLFSPNTVADINARQNLYGYQGPNIMLSIYDTIATPIDITELPEILLKWGRDVQLPIWQNIFYEPSVESRKNYMDLTLFLSRLYNETPREQNGKIPRAVQYHMDTILETLEWSYPKKSLLNLCCHLAKEYTESCGDKLAVGLIQLSLNCQKEKALDLEDVKKAMQALCWVNNIILFIRHINDCKVVYDKEHHSFLDLKSISPEVNQYEDKQLTVDQMTIEERENIFTKRIDEGYKLFHFHIGDEVEDILMLLNHLKANGLVDIDEIEMKYRTCVTLKDAVLQAAALAYLKKNHETTLIDNDLQK